MRLVQIVTAAALLAAVTSASGVASTPPQPWIRLAPYRPQRHVTGVIRNYGFGLDDLLKRWERAFQQFQPGVRFADTLPTSDAAMPALITGVTDLAPDGGEPSLTQNLAFFETYGYPVTTITVASGSYDVNGRSNGVVIYVNKANPIRKLTMQQLDGIFGEQRTGALDGFKWMVSRARGPQSNIRTWGQLGLTGSWANKAIQTYGFAPSGTARFFQLRVLHNSDKWNPNYREYVPTASKMIGPDDPQQTGSLKHMIQLLARDKYGIAWSIEPEARGVAGIKSVAIAPQQGAPFVLPSRASFESGAYPLVRTIYIDLNRAPGHPLDPKLKEFLRFILSRNGQALVEEDGNYVPLTPAVVRSQLEKLE